MTSEGPSLDRAASTHHRRREIVTGLLVLAVVFGALLLTLVFLGSWVVRAGGLLGAAAGVFAAGRRDPPPYGRLLYAGPATPLGSEGDRAFVERLRRERGRLPRVGAVVACVIVVVSAAGALAGHPRYSPFTGSGPAGGSAIQDDRGSAALPGDPEATGPAAGKNAGSGPAPGAFASALHQALLTLMTGWLGILAGVTGGWLGVAMAERAERSDSRSRS